MRMMMMIMLEHYLEKMSYQDDNINVLQYS
jgi:hypothetical protein